MKVDDSRYATGRDKIITTMFAVTPNHVRFEGAKHRDDLSEVRWFPLSEILSGEVKFVSTHLPLAARARKFISEQEEKPLTGESA